MASILLLNTSQWGRGITPIWLASHSGILKSHGHTCNLCDLNFLESWQKDEVNYNSNNGQYLPIDYNYSYSDTDPVSYLASHIAKHKPDIIIWSAVSSHIHGEGEFSSFHRGYEFLERFYEFSPISKPSLVAGGVYIMGLTDAELTDQFPLVDCFLKGDSEHLLLSAADILDSDTDSLPPFITTKGNRANLSSGYSYDYSIFPSQSLIRPYHGNIVKAVDYEVSRGCPFSCSYCVETIIQKHYDSTETNSRNIFERSGTLLC